MQILKKMITIDELKEIAAGMFGDMVKAVVDVERELIAVDGELHSDLEALLLSEGSAQKNLWGINLYPGQSGDNFVEFDSMINIRPSQGNMSRGVDSAQLREKIAMVVNRWMKR